MLAGESNRWNKEQSKGKYAYFSFIYYSERFICCFLSY